MVEQLVEGYELSFSENVSAEEAEDLPSAVHLVMVKAASRTWKQLAKERIEDTQPSIPLGKRPPSSREPIIRLEAMIDARIDKALARLVSLQ
jgi:hypothetical protein